MPLHCTTISNVNVKPEPVTGDLAAISLKEARIERCIAATVVHSQSTERSTVSGLRARGTSHKPVQAGHMHVYNPVAVLASPV